ncbi:DUF1700 domain-containing protein [Massilia sp. PAMC28688]|uniref:DUF1700 domain-containing protein n=1 Tax=Massilia sp. PAMC28688 TaxID=2861283 RepID=UPI001C63A227|nr:DUF1700 domain-containing protein [Massilia sp. PAMC28688]QYF93183.1 DUF1700 domain-containing protein [Massilia sp. PAMC28688]
MEQNMGKTDYLEALRRAMTGLPPEAQAKTLALYEQRFVDGVLNGQSEEDVARELDDPKKIALTLRASIHLQSFNRSKSPATFVRMAFAAVGLLIFNLVMVLPAMVYAAVLAAIYAFGFAAYLYGVVITASGLTGVTEVNLDGVGQYQHREDNGSITRHDINVRVLISGPNMRFFASQHPGREKQVGTAGFMFASELEDASRPVQSFLGLGITLFGILMLLMSVLMTRYTLVGIRRYIDMNFSLLKGH